MFGIEPSRIIFIHLQNEKDLLWADGGSIEMSVVLLLSLRKLSVNEFHYIQKISAGSGTKSCYRFCTPVKSPQILNTNASGLTLENKSLPSETYDALPGWDYPRWNVELLKIRNGKPGELADWNGQKNLSVPS